MVEAAFRIPLTNVPQTFQIVLGNITYTMTSKWNDADDSGWVLDIADADGNPLAANIPLITGGNCLDGLDYLGINGQLYVNSSGSTPQAVPTLNNLGIDSNLYFITEVASV